MTVLTLGTFDLFHRGHVRLLECAAALGPLTVAVNTDRHIAKFKGAPPVMTYQERADVVAACRYVDRVIANTADGDSTPIIRDVKPAFIVVGDDWHGKDYLAQLGVTKELLAKHGTAVVYVPYTAGISTTDILRRCDSTRRGPVTDAGEPDVPDGQAAGDTLLRQWRRQPYGFETPIRLGDILPGTEHGGLGSRKTWQGSGVRVW